MIDRRRRRGPALPLAIVVAASLWGRPAAAHVTTEATARVTLRDGHLDVVTEVDVFALVRADPTALATGGDDALARVLDDAVRALVGGTQLVVDGAVVPLSVQTLPPLPELRATAAWLSSQGQDHGALLSFALQATTLVDEPRSVRLSMPSALGPVIATFAQPQTRYVQPGDDAAFAVLAPTTDRGGPQALGVAALVAGAALVVAAWRLRPRAPRAAPTPGEPPASATTG